MKNKSYIVLCIDGGIEEFNTIDDAKKFIRKEYVDEEAGIHPDIESVFIIKRIIDIKVKELDDEFHEIVFDRVTDGTI